MLTAEGPAISFSLSASFHPLSIPNSSSITTYLLAVSTRLLTPAPSLPLSLRAPYLSESFSSFFSPTPSPIIPRLPPFFLAVHLLLSIIFSSLLRTTRFSPLAFFNFSVFTTVFQKHSSFSFPDYFFKIFLVFFPPYSFLRFYSCNVFPSVLIAGFIAPFSNLSLFRTALRGSLIHYLFHWKWFSASSCQHLISAFTLDLIVFFFFSCHSLALSSPSFPVFFVRPVFLKVLLLTSHWLFTSTTPIQQSADLCKFKACFFFFPVSTILCLQPSLCIFIQFVCLYCYLPAE